MQSGFATAPKATPPSAPLTSSAARLLLTIKLVARMGRPVAFISEDVISSEACVLNDSTSPLELKVIEST